jgi:RNA polymerase sigma factor for flagellar operon FliA
VKTKKHIDIDQVWKQFHKTHDNHFRNLLMEHYGHLVKSTAKRLHRKLPDNVELDDLISAGNFGLMGAINTYDLGRGIKFETYGPPRIKGSILDELRELDWLPRLVRKRATQLMKTRQLLKSRLGRKPSEKEIAAELNMDREEFKRLQRDANVSSLLSLDTKYTDTDNEEGISKADIVIDNKSQDPLIEAQKRDLKSFITKGLSSSEILIFTLYYYEEMTMKEIGLTLGLSESRVSQVHKSILARLKAKMDDYEKEFRF